MTRRCELTGKLPLSGQLRSHAENKTKRKFRPNLCEVTLISDALGRKVRLRVSAHAFRAAGRELHRLAVPTVFVQEGGYNLQTLGLLVNETLTGFEE